MNFDHMARYVVERAHSKRIGVFVIDGRIKTIETSNDRFERLVHDAPRYLIGVYDGTHPGLEVDGVVADIKTVHREPLHVVG